VFVRVVYYDVPAVALHACVVCVCLRVFVCVCVCAILCVILCCALMRVEFLYFLYSIECFLCVLLCL
jgi:hypothetical protein